MTLEQAAAPRTFELGWSERGAGPVFEVARRPASGRNVTYRATRPWKFVSVTDHSVRL